MPTKLQQYSELAEQSVNRLTNSRENWTEYLAAAARLYKYPFTEQLMIYAQRPNAVACAPIETWNKSMNRSVKRGAKGIALIDDSGGEPRLKYVYDYVDTEGWWKNSRRPFIWQMNPEHETPVMESLAKIYGDSDGTLAGMLYNIAENLAEEYYNSNEYDIQYSFEGSFLEDYGEDNIRVAFREAVTVSTAYSLMSRCGFDPDDYFGDEDFNCIFDFNTLDSVNALGTAVSDLSEQVLREIEVTIKNYERSKTAERRTANEHNVHQTGGLFHSQPDIARTTEGNNREIRTDAEELHQESPQDTVQFSASERNADRTSVGDRQDGERENRADNGRVGEEEPAAGQGDRSDGVGTAHEQSESSSGGINTGRTDIQLENDTGAVDEATPFSMAELAKLHSGWDEYVINAIVREETVMNAAVNSDRQGAVLEIEAAVKRIHLEISQDILGSATIQNKGNLVNELDNYFNKERTPPFAEQLYNTVVRSDEYKERLAEETESEQPENADITRISQNEENDSQFGINLFEGQEYISLTEVLETSGISPDTVDAMLRDGGNRNNSLLRIAAHYMKGKTPAENADFLANEYNKGGKGLKIDGERFSMFFDASGITFAEGATALHAVRSVTLSWEQVESRVRELLYTGQYISQSMIDTASGYERKQLANKIWYLHQDLADGAEFFMDDDIFRGGFPDSTECISAMLSQPEQLDNIIDGLRGFADAYENDRSILRFHRIHNPRELIRRLSDLYIEPVAFTAGDIPKISSVPFVSDDDIESLMTYGSGVESGKFRVYSYFLHEHTSKEKADFLKDEYGTGGSYPAILGTDNMNKWHDSKGIAISRGSISAPDDKVVIPWIRAARIIDNLINEGKYMTRAELDLLLEYEKNELTREIYWFHNNLPPDMSHPYPLDANYYDAVKAIRPILDDPAQVDALLESMRPVWEVTPPEDRYYNTRQKAYTSLTAYRDGTFTLFPQLSAVAMPEDNIPLARPSARREQSDQLSLFSFPTVEEQHQSIMAQAEDFPPDVFVPVIEQSDIDEAIRNWNGSLGKKFLVYSYMSDSALARSRNAADFLKEEYGSFGQHIGDLSAFTVTKAGAESVVLPWAKVQSRIAQLIDADEFLLPDEQEHFDRDYNDMKDDTSVENEDSQPGIAENNYNLFELIFPQIVNGSYLGMTFKNERDKHELSIAHDTTNAGLIHFEISYYKPDGTLVFDPMITFEADFENRMLKPIQYANTLSGEDIGILSVPSPDDARRLDAVSIGVYNLLSDIENQGFELTEGYVFHDEKGNVLPAEPKQNISAFLKEQADRESAAHFNVIRNMPGVAAESSQPQETQEYTDFFQADLNRANPVLREILTNSLLNQNEKDTVSVYINEGKATNRDIAELFSGIYSNNTDSALIYNGEKIVYTAKPQGIIFNLKDNSDANHTYTWSEISEILRGLYNQGLDGFGLPAPEQAVEQEISEPEQTALVYAVGDTVYLENDRHFIIDEIGDGKIILSDPTLIIPILREIETEDFEALLRENPRNNHMIKDNGTVSETSARDENAIPTSIPITKAVVDTFAKSDRIHYAKHTDGSVYISNDFYMMKTTEQDLISLTEQINGRKRSADIEVIENVRLLNHIDNANGTFELAQKPYELTAERNTAYFYTDGKQYFEYAKQYVDIFGSGENRLFVDNNGSYDINSHHMVVKNSSNEVLGIVLPIKVPDEMYERLADVLPLEVERKSKVERIKENSANNPYIGKEYFDGRNTYIISGIINRDGVDLYSVPTIENGKLSGSAQLVKVDDIENQIALWEDNRVYAEKQSAENEIRAQREAEIKTEYENTNGYADIFSPMQKANVLRVLNNSFSTKDYGNLKMKQFIEAAVNDGKTFEPHNSLKKKYADMGVNEYINNEIRLNMRGDVWGHYRTALNNIENVNSPNALWLKENHPFLHYNLFNDISVLDASYLSTEYRLMIDDNTFYEIPKTAFDYGNHLINNAVIEKQTPEETAVINELPEDEIMPLIPPDAPAIPKPQAQNRINFRITDDYLGEGSAKTKFNYNIEAIKLLKHIESENRLATPAEQDILSRYVGWGGLPQAFDGNNKDWSKEYTELQSLLSPDEYSMARASTLNAHYTSPVVIKAIYEAVERMGFKTGNILEPACGVGNFLGLLPDSMAQSKLYGVELDSITGRIAKQLYQKADITISGFEKTDMPDAFFDIAIGNVPFGDYKVADKRYDKHNFFIHDYFFGKTLDQVRSGGVIAFVTSKGTMDKQNPSVRKYIAQRAELLGAVRLPNDAFLKNAGTETATDIIFLQKRDRIIDIEPEWVHLGVTEDGIPVNSYFAENPEMILGTMEFDKRMNDKFGRNDLTTCYPLRGENLADLLKTAITNIRGEITEPELDDIGENAETSVPADPSVRNYSYTIVDNKVYYRENSRMYPVDQAKMTADRIRGMIALRDCVHELIDYQLHDYSDGAISSKQTELNMMYDRFTEKYGLINSKGNSLAFSNDSAYYLLCSLEILDENGMLARKADMFTKRTIKQKTVVTSVDTASEALAVSIAEKACVDLGYMAQLMGGSDKIQEIVNDLRGVIFKDPLTGAFDMNGQWYAGWQTADEYLSGNVREKLRTARTAAEKHPEFAVNAEALEKVQPKDLDASEISVRLGATWINQSYVQQFAFELLQPSAWLNSVINIHYSAHTSEWGVSGIARVPSTDVLATVTYGTHRMNAYEIIRETLNLKDVRVFDTKIEGGKEIRKLNKKETTLAARKQEAIRQAFKEWIFKDPTRRRTLVSQYNEMFNSVRPREYDGSHINFVGMSAAEKMKPFQANAVARNLYGGNTLLAHVVGAGKTFIMVATAMESKRLGLAQKSLFAVPNHLTEQTASEFLRLYPSANLLVATAKDFETKNRKKFCAKIATGDYDAVIIGHTQLEKIPISKERQERLLQEQLDEITGGIAELKLNKGERFTIKQLEKAKKSVAARIEKLNDGSRKDDIVTFEQLGVDRLFVDESHSFNEL